MSGDWPADPRDPRCPECGEPVSATASYCMHCYVDLPSGSTDAAGATIPADTPTPFTAEQDPAAPGASTLDREAAEPGMPTAEPPAGYSGWLHPDSAVDDVSTALVGLVGGVLVGVLALLLAVWALPQHGQSSWGLAVGIVGWLVATAWIARTRTVFGAIRKAAYSFAGLLGLVPPFVAFAIRDFDALLFGVVLWPVALVVAAVGRFAGRGAVSEG